MKLSQNSMLWEPLCLTNHKNNALLKSKRKLNKNTIFPDFLCFTLETFPFSHLPLFFFFFFFLSLSPFNIET